MLAFPTVITAATAAPSLRRTGIATAEGMGSDLIDALQSNPGGAVAEGLLPGADLDETGHRKAGGWLFCEITGATAADALARGRRLESEFADHDGHPTIDSTTVSDSATIKELWRIRESAAGLATRLPDGREAWPSWEDSAVPPDQLGAYLRDLYELLDEHDLEGIPFGHFGEGCVHLRISFDLGSDDGIAAFRAFMCEAASLVARHGGSLSGEHGDGRARSELLPQMYSAECLRVFSAFKAIFDPDDFFNPGVLIAPEPFDSGVRPGPGQRTHEFIPVHALSRDHGSLVDAVNRCVGVGMCRTETDAMCPSFQITRDEVHTTRGRARVLSEMFRGELYPEGVGSDDVREALDLCLSCRACASECPVNVDMATYKSEFLHRHYRGRLRPMSHYSMGWLPLLSHLLHLVPGTAVVADHLMTARPLKKLVMASIGVDADREMISFAARSFQSTARRPRAGRHRKSSKPAAPTVVLWPDSFSNHLDPSVPAAAKRVLEALGEEVVVPRGFLCCGLTWHSTGQLGMVRRILRHTLDRIAEQLDGSTPIICLEPSCASMLVEELPQLMPDHPRVPDLVQQVCTLGEFIERHIQDGGKWPLASSDMEVLSQVHCHERARSAHGGTASVLAHLGVEESLIDTGCCGLAGNWGFEPGHAEMSKQLGERELFPRVRELETNSAVLADGFSCRTHIKEGTGVRAKHLAHILAEALPESDAGLPNST